MDAAGDAANSKALASCVMSVFASDAETARMSVTFPSCETSLSKARRMVAAKPVASASSSCPADAKAMSPPVELSVSSMVKPARASSCCKPAISTAVRGVVAPSSLAWSDRRRISSADAFVTACVPRSWSSSAA